MTSNRHLPGRLPLLALLLLVAAALVAFTGRCPEQAARDSVHLVVLGDPHLPGKHLAHKEQVRHTINSWRDVDLVVAVGDICDEYGTPDEYRQARSYFARLNKPLALITGNHDYIYETPSWPGGGGYKLATRAVQEEKLALFRHTFRLSTLSHSRLVGGYLLIFLSADHERYPAGVSEAQMTWLRAELAGNSGMPTIIFFHGPLQGTQHPFRHYINRPTAMAQPVEALHQLIITHPQIFLWISGHTHTPATEESYAAPINLYAGQVTNIHNADMKRDTIWTNSLFLHADRVVVRTYNHRQGAWMPELERTVIPPRLGSD